MYSLVKYLPAGLAHDLAPVGLRIYSDLCGVQKTPEWQSFTWRGLHFANRLGIAGGVDKDAENLDQWQKLGCGFVEIGTVTPKPQRPNPGRILARDWEHSNLWNKMGFPSAGAKEVATNLLHSEHSLPIFVNIGKNRNISNELATANYLESVEVLKSSADAFIINVSSPNTKDLRELQNKDALLQLTSAVVAKAEKIPVILKLSPDLSLSQLQESIEAGMQGGTSGFVLTNTTTHRPSDCFFPLDGGLAGKDLAAKSKTFLKETIRILGTSRQNLLLISVGGVLSEKDVQERLELGADLVEVYSALVFQGPGFFQKVATTFQKASLQ